MFHFRPLIQTRNRILSQSPSLWAAHVLMCERSRFVQMVYRSWRAVLCLSLSHCLSAVSHPQIQAGLASGWPGLGMLSVHIACGTCGNKFVYSFIFNSTKKMNAIYYNNLVKINLISSKSGPLYMCSLILVWSNTVWSAFWESKSAPRVFKGLWRSLKAESGWTERHLSRPGRISRFWPSRWFRPSRTTCWERLPAG